MYAKGKGSTVPSDAQAREKYDFVQLDYQTYANYSSLLLFASCLKSRFEISIKFIYALRNCYVYQLMSVLLYYFKF